MKHIFLTTFFYMPKTPKWSDNIKYSITCTDPIEDNTIAPSEGDFEYSVDFNAEFNQSRQ